MAKPAVPPTATDDEVRALLVRYRCPVPFHEVRTRFLGNIASPGMGISPIKVVEGLWGGTLPEFETIDAANELIGALVMGLWNRFSRHQDRNAPFRLTRIESGATREGLAALAMLRRQELDAFVEACSARRKCWTFRRELIAASGRSARCGRCSKGPRLWPGTRQSLEQRVIWKRHCGSSARLQRTPSTKFTLSYCPVRVRAVK
jgi:hypothetical protein